VIVAAICFVQAAKRDLIVSAKNLYLIGREKVTHLILKV